MLAVSPNGISQLGRSPSVLATHELCAVAQSPEQVTELIEQEERRRWRVGLYLIATGVVTWVMCTEMMNGVLKGSDYTCVFFISYVQGACFLLYLLPDLWKRLTRTLPEPVKASMSTRDMTVLAVQVSVLYFLYNAFVASALRYTSAADQTILSTTSSIFTLLLGVYMSVERFTIFKFLSLGVSFGGIILINLTAGTGSARLFDDDTFTPTNPVLGNCFAILASFMYSLYLILIKVRVGTSTTVNERQLFGYVGLATMATCWPFVVVGHLSGYDPFVLPPSSLLWAAVALNGVLLVVSDYCVALAMLLTSPVITSLSLTTAIPLTMLCDSIIYGVGKTGRVYYLGIGLIFSSFVIINFSSQEEVVDEALAAAVDDALLHNDALTPLLSPLFMGSPRHRVKPRGKTSSGYLRFQTVVTAEDTEDLPLVLPLALPQNVGYFSLTEDRAALVGLPSPSPPTALSPMPPSPHPPIFVRGGVNHRYVIEGLSPSPTAL